MGKSIFEALGIDPGQKIIIHGVVCNPHYIDEDGSLCDCLSGVANELKWELIARGDYTILPLYTADEIAILRGCRAAGYNYVAKDQDGQLFAYEEKPKNNCGTWYPGKQYFVIMGSEKFAAISRDDSEPLDIAAALDEIDREEQDQ